MKIHCTAHECHLKKQGDSTIIAERKCTGNPRHLMNLTTNSNLQQEVPKENMSKHEKYAEILLALQMNLEMLKWPRKA